MPSFNSRVMWHARNILSKVAKRYRVGIIIWHNASRGIVVSTFIPHWTISAILNDSNPFEPILTREICYFFAHSSFDSLRSRKCWCFFIQIDVVLFIICLRRALAATANDNCILNSRRHLILTTLISK